MTALSNYCFFVSFVVLSHLYHVCCQDLKVSRCAGEGMDVTLTGPFQGVLTVKGTTCQIQVRLTDTSPLMFFVPYGEKCAIKVNRMGRAMFTLVIAEQKLPTGFTSKAYYDVREVSLLCTYYINVDLNATSRGQLGFPGEPEVTARERSFYPPEIYESPLLTIDD